MRIYNLYKRVQVVTLVMLVHQSPTSELPNSSSKFKYIKSDSELTDKTYI
jgi:hypothetical protein